MAKISKLTILLLILLTVCAISQRLQADTSIYVFGPDQSIVIKTGGFAGVHETYAVTGQFWLTVDSDSSVASFEKVDANLTDETGIEYGQTLDEIFNMTGLAGTVVDGTTIEFEGKTADGTESDVSLKLSIKDDSAHLTGNTTPPPNSADMFFYDVNAVATKKYAGGTGEPNDPYLIYTAEQLNAIGAEPNDWDKHFKLMADIDLSDYTGTDFNIIGVDMENPFTGLFDGNGHTISNFSYTSVDTSYIGIFGCVGLQSNRGEIRDLGLLDSVVDAGSGGGVGLLVGLLHDGTVTNCYCVGGSVSGGVKVGGLLGGNGGTITNCYAVCSVSCSGNMWYGGVGGLVGFNSTYINNCYAACSVTGNTTVGGLLGMNSGHVINCYSTSSVSGTESVGGLLGVEWGGSITNSFWNIDTSGQALGDDGRGKTTAEMQTLSTFTNAGWDFVDETENGTEDIWSICEGTNYPHLVWQIPAGDFVCPDGITKDDFLFFMEHWLDDNCDASNNYCEGTDLDQSGTVDVIDLEIFFEYWSAEQ